MLTQVNPVARIMSLVKLERTDITAIYFHAILNGLIQLSLPVGVQAIVGFVLGGAMSSSLVILIALVVTGVLFGGLLQIGQMRLIERVQQKLFVRNSFDLAARIPKLDMKDADAYYLPELMNRFFEIPTLQKSLSKLLLDIPTASIQIVFGLLLLSFYHPAFILFGILLLVVLWMILYYTGNRGLSTSLTESRYKYKVAAWLQEMSRLAKTFKFSKGSELNLERTDTFTTKYLKARNDHFGVLQFQFKILVAFKVLITASMLIVGAVLLVNQQLNIGQFIAAEIVILTVINSVEKLIGNLDSVYDVLTSITKIATITDKPIEKDGTYLMPFEAGGIKVETKGLSFGYEDKKILSDLSLIFHPGQTICISGNEGAGKSTFLQLLTGCYSTFQGAILLNNLPVGNYDLTSLRSQMGILLPGQDIFNGSLWDNISMGNAHVTQQQVLGLFEKTGLLDFIATQKAGFETKMVTSGKRLSRNVLQKLLLVRALAGRPRLLLLEDPWLGMEQKFAEQIKQYLLKEMPGTTVIVVSNDVSFANQCDQQIYLSL